MVRPVGHALSRSQANSPDCQVGHGYLVFQKVNGLVKIIIFPLVG